MRFIRRVFRLIALVYWSAYQCIVSYPISRQKDRKKAIRDMARQTQFWGAGLLRVFGTELTVHGDVGHYHETGGFVVSNHLGYLDVFVHAACFGLRFTPKKDIQSWPLFGWYAGITLPIWVDRESRGKSVELLEQFRETLHDKVPLIIYPEGTSTDGNCGVLPFKPTSFETVVGTDIPIQPILTLYSVAEGDTSPCWFGDESFLPHIWKLLGNKKTKADVYLLPVTYAGGRNRKQLAADVHRTIQEAYDIHHAAPQPLEKEQRNG